MDFILDIKEKDTTQPIPPSFPQIRSSTSGFPEHKKRTRVSAFKQKRQGIPTEEKKPAVFSTGSSGPLPATESHDPSPAGGAATFASKVDVKESIDRENNNKLSSMSSQEIEQARQELFNGLDPSILDMLLKRANLDEKHSPSPFDEPAQQPRDIPEIKVEDTTVKPKRVVRFSDAPLESTAPPSTASQKPPQVQIEDAAEEETPSSAVVDEATPTLPSADQILSSDLPPPSSKPHWPQPPETPDIDPNDPDFLASLHEKYFPSLPADPAKLAWMAPIPTPNSPADYDSPYHPSQSSLPVSQLRFDFRGTLLPPRISRAVPVSKGLHHHGEAPEAAGYTIAELARLARSAVPGQRCIAYQTLGRVLFRLGRGEFGPLQDEVPSGLWGGVVEGGVMESLYEEAGMDPDGKGVGKSRGHRSAHAFAVEAIWLFEKGGWKEKIRRGK